MQSTLVKEFVVVTEKQKRNAQPKEFASRGFIIQLHEAIAIEYSNILRLMFIKIRLQCSYP